MSKIRLLLELENIGIHENLKTSFDVDSCKLGIYANNGSGKTFISKAFSLYSKAANKKAGCNDAARILTFEKMRGKFKFQVGQIGSSASTCELEFNSNSGVTKYEPSKYIFHVFNSDYVRENLESCNYAPDGRIEGMMVPKI